MGTLPLVMVVDLSSRMWRWQQSQRSDDIMMTGGGIIYRWYGASS
jgi:hypothetical protein